MTEDRALKSYRRIAWITIAAVYFLILVGSTVRASGAGMGCPDWPTCFGSWIPPVSEAQLPDNYREIYADRGYADTPFNPVKTWTEYVNRLVGVTIGLLIFLTAWKSWGCRRHDAWIFRASVAAFLMVGFQGWLGAQVVASNLQPGMITLHMVMALAIVATLLFALARARRHPAVVQAVDNADPRFYRWLNILVGMTVLQVIMGTQVREMNDFFNHTAGLDRPAWVAAMPWFFFVHRSFSALVLACALWVLRLLWLSLGGSHALTRFMVAMLAVMVIAITSGAALSHLGMPAAAQPIHLLTASLLFGLQFLIWMEYRHARDAAPEDLQEEERFRARSATG
ncbi:MAG: COX15/CtaA family protein [Pseudohongiellaceae bacterium]